MADVFRRFNKVHKQISYACMCRFVFFPFTPQAEASHQYFSDKKNSLHVNFSCQRRENLMTLRGWMSTCIWFDFNVFDGENVSKWNTCEKVVACIHLVELMHVCCPDLNSAIPALSHYHTEQTECVCWVANLSAALEQHPPPLLLLPSHLLPSSLHVICRLHTYAAYLSGSLSMGLRVNVRARAAVSKRRQTIQTYHICKVFPESMRVFP